MDLSISDQQLIIVEAHKLPGSPRMAAIVLNRGYISADAIESFHLPGKAANETAVLVRYLMRNISSDRTSYLSCCKQRLMRS